MDRHVCLSVAFLILLTIIKLARGNSNEEVLVQLNNGQVRGKIEVDENGNDYYSFMSIPYAEPPTEHRRFRAPVPKSPWSSVLDATSPGPWCPQIDFLTKKFIGEEDNCLTLNVYTPKIPKIGDKEKLNVLFHIHGGGFIFGNGGSFFYNPARFMQKDKNFIIVSINYRLSILGFLSTESSASPGNYGLLDQVEALRWVRNNIDRFGGDADRVTLIGESAGGASVVYLMQSPLTKGFFHRAIVMSGSSVQPWAFQHSPLHWTKTVAKTLNCPSEDHKQLMHCLRQKTAQELTENDLSLINGVKYIHFTPTVDGLFIQDDPLTLLKNKQLNAVPTLMGVTKDEGMVWFRAARPSDDDFTEKELDLLLGSFFANVANKEGLLKLLKKKYFPNFASLNGAQVHEILHKLVTDGCFHARHYETVKWFTAAGIPTYVYSYDYVKEGPGIEEIFNVKKATGAHHACEMGMLFNGLMATEPLSGPDLQIQKKFQKIITDFAMAGNPKKGDGDLKWSPSQPDKINIYHINKEDSVEVHDEAQYSDMYKFWVEEVRNAIKKTMTSRDEL